MNAMDPSDTAVDTDQKINAMDPSDTAVDTDKKINAMDPSDTAVDTDQKMNAMDPSDTAVDTDQKIDPEGVRLPTLSPQDKETAIHLYQTCPKLWSNFRHVLDFCDMADQPSPDYARLLQAIAAVSGIFEDSHVNMVSVAQFAAVVGVAEQAVKVMRFSKTTGEMSLGFVSILQDQDHIGMCTSVLLTILLNLTDIENEIRLRLAKTGFFSDIAECLRSFQHLPAQLLAFGYLFLVLNFKTVRCYRTGKNGACDNLLGILHNCCKSPSVALLVQQMDIAPLVAEFVTKTQTHNIRISAMAVLASIVRDDQLTLLELDAALLTTFLTLSAPECRQNGWHVEEIIVVLSLLARLDFNRRLIVAKESAVDVLLRTLRSGTETEQEAAATTLEQLAKDPVNAQIFKRHKELVQLLSSVEDSKREALRQAVSNTLTVIGQVDADIGDLEENTSLYDVLAEQLNALTILGVGKVEFVLRQLTQITSGGSSSHGDVTRVKVLQALQELATDSSCAREIFSRGGLHMLYTLIGPTDTDTDTDTARDIDSTTPSETSSARPSDNDNDTSTARDIDSATPTDTDSARPSDSGSDSDSVRGSVRLESTRLLLQLASCKEHCLLIQAHPQLTQRLTTLRQRLTTLTQRDDSPLSQACAGLLEAIGGDVNLPLEDIEGDDNLPTHYY